MSVNVLLADDEKGFVEALARRLTKRGYTVQQVNSGRAAVDILADDSSVDVVVLDVRMPEPNGLDTLHLIKTKYPAVEVVMLSAYGTPLCTMESIRWGAFKFLNKPVELNELITTIDEAAKVGRVHRQNINAKELQMDQA